MNTVATIGRMPAEQSPAFQFYVKEWRSSRAIQRMSFAERGMYLELLLEQWETLSVPDDPRACAARLGGTVEEWIAAWPVLRRKFCDRRGRPRQGDDHATNFADPAIWNAHKQIINVKLEVVRKVQRRYKKTAKVGGKTRATGANRNHNGTYSHSSQPADTPAATPAAHPAISSTPSPSPTATPSPSPTASYLPAAIGKERPLTGYQQLKVWPWFVHRWLDRLGAVEFDHDRWLLELDGTLTGLLPATGQQWFDLLNRYFEAEVLRLGLPLAADALPEAPTNKRILGLHKGGEAFLRRVADQRAREGS